MSSTVIPWAGGRRWTQRSRLRHSRGRGSLGRRGGDREGEGEEVRPPLTTPLRTLWT